MSGASPWLAVGLAVLATLVATGARQEAPEDGGAGEPAAVADAGPAAGGGDDGGVADDGESGSRDGGADDNRAVDGGGIREGAAPGPEDAGAPRSSDAGAPAPVMDAGPDDVAPANAPDESPDAAPDEGSIGGPDAGPASSDEEAEALVEDDGPNPIPRWMVGAGAMGTVAGLTLTGIVGGAAVTDWVSADDAGRSASSAEFLRGRATTLGVVAACLVGAAGVSAAVAVAGGVWGLLEE